MKGLKKLDFNKTFSDPDLLMELMLEAIHKVTPSELALLFATGKSELDIRTLIVQYLHKQSNGLFVATREWNLHDLAVLEDGQPILAVEGKSWIHRNATNPEKLNDGDKSIKWGFEKDLNKLLELRSKYPSVNIYLSTILFSIDVSGLSQSEIDNLAIKYGSEHRLGIQEQGNFENLTGMGRSKLTEFLQPYGTVKRLPINTGKYHGLDVWADLFLLLPIN